MAMLVAEQERASGEGTPRPWPSATGTAAREGEDGPVRKEHLCARFGVSKEENNRQDGDWVLDCSVVEASPPL
jgi:hypothetical protein